MRILFVGDVFGAPGRRAVEATLPALREELRVDFCIVNGENAADGRGITAKIAERLLASGADVVTLGNWVWGQKGFAPYLSGTDRVLRPANLSPSSPGVGLAVHDGVAVINLLGQMTLNPFESAFVTADRLVSAGLQGDAGDRRRLPRRGDQREGRARLLPGRARDRRARDAHPRADKRRAGARGRDGRRHRRGDDRAA